LNRPALNLVISESEFLRWYWLKEELISFCRENALVISGSKPELTSRIAAHLSGAKQPDRVSVKRNAKMPEKFTPNTVIEPGWRCGPKLGEYFRQIFGKKFRFNAAIRNYIHTQVGCTLEDAAHCYAASIAPDAPKQEIIPQNQYNRHMREYYEQNPHATREQVLSAWWEKRSKAMA
jgi:SAP domain-containing new25/Domain of unknown function (DUF6434)